MNISLYIPCFNSSGYINQCLKGVLKQTYPIKEILVVDDGSTDRTSEIASQFPVRLIRHNRNEGLASARNTALREARYEYIASVDSDCVPERDWLEKLVKTFSSGRIGGAGGRLLESYSTNVFDYWRSVHMRQNWGEDSKTDIPFLFGSNTLFKKKILLELGGYDEELKNNFEDYDISQRIKKAGYLLRYNPEAIVYHLRKDNLFSLFNNFWNWNLIWHRKKKYYDSLRNLSRKSVENIGLANRFLEEDINEKRLQLVYIDFLLSISLTLKDFSFYFKSYSPSQKDSSGISYLLSLLDLTFFYHFRDSQKGFDTLISKENKINQNFSVFILLLLKYLFNKFKDIDFLKILSRHLVSFQIEDHDCSDYLAGVFLNLAKAGYRWDSFIKKKHPYLEESYLNNFFIKFKEWLKDLERRIPDIEDIIKNSSSSLKIRR